MKIFLRNLLGSFKKEFIGLTFQNELTWLGVTLKTSFFHPIFIKTLIQTEIAITVRCGQGYFMFLMCPNRVRNVSHKQPTQKK